MQATTYMIRTRNSTLAFKSNKAEAIKLAKAEKMAGWPSWVKDLTTGKLVWGI